MITFQRRSIAQAKTLGEQLGLARQAAGISVTKIAKALNVREDYIIAIESSNYIQLPSAIFVKQYVRNYAKYLHIYSQSVDKLLQEELNVYQQVAKIPTIKRHLLKQPLKVIQVIMALGIGLLAFSIGIYFLRQINNIIQPPPLILQPLPEQVAANQYFISVSGKTAVEATVLINNQPVTVRPDGSFTQTITLQPGINLLKIATKTKRSRERVEYKQIIVEETNSNTNINNN
ncbi:MAG: helix-turn-helix domain-containing protein [Patescibacteria group bacterium]|jgi:cytoskeletal protein RodZ